MYVEEVARNINVIQNSLATIAVLLNLTGYRYPPAATVINGTTYDYVVVGSGAGGGVVASRLSEDPNTSVLLVEAGGDPPIQSVLPGIWLYNKKSPVDWNHTSQIDEEAFQCFQNDRLRLTHGKVLGGTTSINGMHYVRGDPNDYDTWAQITSNRCWNYFNVLPYFKKSERLLEPSIINSPYGYFHGTNGNIGVTKPNHSAAINFFQAIEEIGYENVLDTNGYNTVGFTKQMVIAADGIRQGTANAFLSPIRDRPNLHVMKESLVTKIIIDKSKRARGVYIKDNNKQTITAYANKEVIVSAGAINSPQVLMLSGIGPEDELRKLNIDVVANLPVGVDLQDDKYINIIVKIKKSKEKPKPFNPHEFPSEITSGFVNLNSSHSYPDYQVTMTTFDGSRLAFYCMHLFGWKKNLCQYLHEQTKDKDVVLILLNGFDKKPKGRVSLSSSNPEDPPSVFIYPFTDQTDIDNYVNYIEDITRLMNTTYFKSLEAEFVTLPQCNNFKVASKEYWGCYLKLLTTTGLHYAGTCPMGPEGSVVDSCLRMRGVEGLRVADASVMPTISSGNTMVPTIMIGEKAADMIRKDNCYDTNPCLQGCS